MARVRHRRGGALGGLCALAAVLLLPASAFGGGKGSEGPRPSGRDQQLRAGGLPDLVLSMTSDASGPLVVGDGFRYTLTVRNVGDAAAGGIAVSDQMPRGVDVVNLLPVMDGGTCSVVLIGQDERQPMFVHCTRDSLPAGASADVTIDVRLTPAVRCGPVTNRAEVSARNEPQEKQGPDNTAAATVVVSCPPSLDLEVASPAAAHEGDLGTLRFAVRNDGKVPLIDVSVSDPVCDSPPRVSWRADPDPVLSPGETWKLACSHRFRASDPDPLYALATARARAEGGGRVSSSSRHSTDILHPAVRIITKASPRSGSPGDRIVYSFTVTNQGDTALFHLEISDDRLGEIGRIPRLAPGRSVTIKTAARLPSGRTGVENSATVRARDALGLIVLDAEGASVSIVRANEGGADSPGGTPFTGSDALGLAMLSLILAPLGVVLLLAARRRRAASDG